MLIQDSNGGCIGALRERLQMWHSNDEAVVLAVQWALVFMPEIRVREATFERDSTPVFSALQLCECSFTSYGCLIQESKKMAKYFCSVDIHSGSKLCNQAAHALALEARKLDSAGIWLEDIPLCITNHLLIYVQPLSY